MTLFTDAIEALGSESRGGRLWKSGAQILQNRFSLLELLELVIGVTQLEHRIRHLAATRVAIDDFLKLDDALLEIARYVMRLAQPVLCITGITTFWKPVEKRLELGLGFFIPAFFEGIESSLVCGLLFTLCNRGGCWRRCSLSSRCCGLARRRFN